MSRSFRKTPIVGITTARSEKDDKRFANRCERHRARQAIRTCRDFDALVLPLKREMSDLWDFAKDGKVRFYKDSPFYGRMYRKLMRK